MQLTPGVIERIMAGGDASGPVLQVLGIKKISGSGGNNQQDRYRVLLSDGKHSHSSAMLATQLNDLVVNGKLDNFAVIKLEKFVCNTIQDRKVMILLSLSVISKGSEVGSKLGDPEPYKQSSGGGAATGGSSNYNASAGASSAAKPTESFASKPLQPQTTNNAPGTPVQNKNKGFYGGNKPYGIQNVPNTPGGTPTRVHPINSLTPYQNRWTIRARVSQKSAIRTWSNSRGEGKLFSMNLLDESGEIKCTAFKEQVDKFYDLVEVNKIYYVSKATLKTADKRYSSLNNDYEMTFNSESQMWLCEDNNVDLPSVNFNFIPINKLEGHAPNTTVDVIGVVKHCDDLSTVTSKQSNKEIKKRDVHLVDESQSQIRMTLWGTEAESFDGSSFPVVAVKGCRLSEWGGRSLSVQASSQMLVNPDIEASHRLRGWYDSEGHMVNYTEFRSEGQSSGGRTVNWKTFSEAKGEKLLGDQALYYTTKATITHLKKDNCMYMACPTQECNKKVVDQANGMFQCEKCNKQYPNFKWRMILQCNLSDFTDNVWATFFQETAELILGKSADDIGQLKQDGNDATFDQIFQDAGFKQYIFKFRGKIETYNDESRLKTICVQAAPVNFKEYNQKLISDIEKLLQE